MKYWIRFRPDPSSVGGVMHPPTSFSLGGNKGYLFYHGQPQYYRSCFKYGHAKDSCDQGVTCRNCKTRGHEASSCSAPHACDICGECGHLCREAVEERWQGR